MPQVPGPRVATSPLPGVRAPTSIPREVFGGPDVAGGVAQVADVGMQLVEKARARADQVALLDADNRLAALQTDVHTKATQRKGKDAMGATSEATEAWRKGAAEIEQGLASDRQKEAFRRRAQLRWQGLYSGIESHASAEAERFDQETTLAGVANRITVATDDPALAPHAAAEARAILTDYWRSQGASDEVVTLKAGEAVSKVHVGAISGMLAQNMDREASAYFREHKAEIVGDDRVRVENAVSKGTTLGDGQREADRILSVTKTFDEARAEAAKLDDPEVRKEAEGRIRQEYSDRAASKRQEREDAVQRATSTVVRTGSYYAIPLADREKLSAGENESLRRLAESKANPKRETDMVTYYALVNLASLNDATRKDFMNLDLMQFRGKLDETDFERLASRQQAMRDRAQRKSLDDTFGDAPETASAGSQPDVRISVPPDWITKAIAGDPEYYRYLKDLGVQLPARPDQAGGIVLRAQRPDSTGGNP
jgi:hypothetical protein